MTQKTKKQHYVPQFYLNAWGIQGTHQIYVYDKKSEAKRKNNIQDVATERFFYDISPNDIFSDGYIETLHQNGILWDEKDVPQIIENALSKEIEKPFSDLIKEVLDKTLELTPWHINNCYFISQEKKADFSAYLALQHVRGKCVRSGIQDSSDCLTQVMEDMGFPDYGIAEYAVSKDEAKKIHLQMLLDPQHLSKVTGCFYNLTWMLGINKTDKKFFTSDNPIGTRGYIKNPILSMNGIGSKGVEVFFPLSPEIILIMVDGSYHTQWIPFERKYIEIHDSANVDYYNSILATQAGRFVFSADGHMDLLEAMKNDNPSVFEQPQGQVSWGGKTYYPRRK